MSNIEMALSTSPLNYQVGDRALSPIRERTYRYQHPLKWYGTRISHGHEQDSDDSIQGEEHTAPHAEASTFKDGVSRADAYKQVLEQMKSLMEGQKNWVW
ncbi:hypothetical protein V492_07387 [Pseudogymnoascus sp. VKM F-4246]|nr:hypothetical protein V492_07387 [Pseudogymnoascus sp. VKM F-4246]